MIELSKRLRSRQFRMIAWIGILVFIVLSIVLLVYRMLGTTQKSRPLCRVHKHVRI